MKVYAAHNEHGHALPSVISEKGNEIIYYPERLPSGLWQKLAGKIEVMEITVAEAEAIFKAKRATRKVSAQVVRNVFSN